MASVRFILKRLNHHEVQFLDGSTLLVQDSAPMLV